MSTRSAIAIAHGNRIKAVYCHYDGYVEHNGYILQNFYRDSVIANKLVAQGDISALGAEIDEVHDFNSRSEYIEQDGHHVAKQCTFYNRDRGESTSWLSFGSVSEFTREYGNWGCEYFYLFKNDRWYVRSNRGRWRTVSRALATV